MALSLPAGLQGLVSASPEFFSTSSLALAPWRHLLGGASSSSTTTKSTPLRRGPSEIQAPNRRQEARSTLPDCFASINGSMLRPKAFSAAVGEVPTAAGLFTATPRSSLHRISPITHPAQLAQSFARQYSTLNRLGPLKLQPISTRINLGQIQRRTLFGIKRAAPPHYLAHVEQTANNNPKSASAQNAFYSACMRANRPDIVVHRYESGRFASNPACEQIYIRASERLGIDNHQTSGEVSEAASQNGPLSQDQRHALSQAVAARIRGGSSAALKQGTGDKNSPMYVVVQESVGGWFFSWFKFLLWFGFITWGFYVAVTLLVEASGVIKRVGGTQNAEAKAEMQTTRFSDVHGCDEAKEELQELVEFLKAPEKFNALGGKPPKGVLMVGPPGTGKTLLARAVAGEAGVPFFYMSGSEFDEVYVGVGAKRVRELFTAARAKAPSIVFIDELDAIGGRRNERDAAYVKQTLNQLLTDLDGFDQNSGVIFLGATNLPKLLDKALMRPGRFDRQVKVDLPDVRGRLAIIKHHMRNMALDPDVDPALLARGTPGCSGAELENIANQAAVYAAKRKANKITMLDLEWAKDRIMMGSERKSAVIEQKDKVNTAYHEGGHALVALLTPASMPLYKATILPRGHALGITFRLPEMDKVSKTKAEYLADMDVSMGGKVAEELVGGPDEVTSGASSDIQSATATAYAMVTQFGMSEKLGDIDYHGTYDQLSSETKKEIDDEVRRLIQDSKARVTAMLTSKRKELDLLANALLEYELLTKNDMERVINGEKLPDKLKADTKVPIKIPEVPLPIGLPPPAPGSGPGGVPTGVPGGARAGE